MHASDFSYDLPDALIAQSAIEPRDSSRLLVASSGEIVPFAALEGLLEPNDLLVVNRTRVRKARLTATREGTGGTVDVLLVKRIDAKRWQAMFRPARRLRTGVVLTVGDHTLTLVSDPNHGIATIEIDPDANVEAFIATVGEVPLPPYFHGTLHDADRYQTIFAEKVGSAAAPTAALHFTEPLVERLELHGIRFASVDLEVGVDTFRPMSDGAVAEHVIHHEAVTVGNDVVAAVDETRASGGRVVAVGTTVVRSLETAATPDGRISSFSGDTDLFIAPGYVPKVVDAMVTNFHAPRTTLLVMIAAFLGDRWRDLYDVAISEQMRFLSFGDAMFIEVDR